MFNIKKRVFDGLVINVIKYGNGGKIYTILNWTLMPMTFIYLLNHLIYEWKPEAVHR